MPHGSDPRRRPDQQSPDSGSSVPPPWWSALSEHQLPAEGPRVRHRRSWRDRLGTIGLRLSTPVAILAVVGSVVAFGFGYQLIGYLVGAAVLTGLVLVSVIHHRRSTAVRDPGWWR